MSKLKWNFIIDVLLFLFLMAMGGIGFLMGYILLPGSETWEKYGTKVDLTFLGLDRHQWGDVHLILSFIFLGLIILHIILHWRMILELYAKLVRKKNVRWLLGFIFIILSFILLLFFLVINPVVTEGERHQRSFQSKRFQSDEIITMDKKSKSVSPLKEEKKLDNHDKMIPDRTKKATGHGEHQDPNLNIRGFMTLQEVASEYNIPIKYLKEKLRLPADTSGNDNLGRLRKQYMNFKMGDVERIIQEYKRTSMKDE